MNKIILCLVVALSSPFSWGQGTQGNACVIAGAEDAPLTIEEFADFTCHYCVQGSQTIREVLKNYPGKVKLAFRNMPLSFHGPNAILAAKAFSAVCLQSPILANTFQRNLFDHQKELVKEGESFLFKTAESIGVNLTQMKTDMNGDVVAQSLAQDQELARTHNFTGTPSFVIGSETIMGSLPYNDIKAVVDKELAHK